MVSYYDLDTVDLAGLDAVADSFEKLVRGWDLETAYHSQVLGPLSSSDWSGPAADAALPQLTAIRTQIDDAFEEASALAKALRDAHDQFSGAQQKLRTVQGDAKTQGLTIGSDGSVSWPPARTVADRHDPDYSRTYEELASGIATRITDVLKAATEADEAAAAALAGDTGTSTTSFDGKPVGGITEEQAQQAAKLAAQGGNLTDAQLAQLDAMLSEHSGDPRFTTAFFQDLGPKESLLFYGQLSWTSSGNGANDKARAALMKTLQTELGKSLATATDSAKWPHLSDAWEAQLRQAGTQKFNTSMTTTGDPQAQVYGFQILANYLKTGTYDEKFLLPTAEQITDLSMKDGSMWTNTTLQGTGNLLNYLDATAGYNPLSGVLTALGRNPQASLDYFSAGGGKYLDYLTTIDNNNALIITDSTTAGPTAAAAAYKAQMATLGDALQSATTGLPFDAPNGTAVPLLTSAEAKLANIVINKFGTAQNSEMISGEDGQPTFFAPLSTSLAHISAAYMGDIDRSLSNSTNRLSTYGASANLMDLDSKAAVRQLLHVLGRDPNAYGIVTQAQNAYTAAQLQNAVKSGVSSNQLGNVLSNISQSGGTANGILSQAKIQELQQTNGANADAYNAAIDRNTGIANTVWSMTAGSLVDKIPVIGGTVNSGVSQYIDTLASGYKTDATPQSIQQSGHLDSQAQQATSDAAQKAVTHALQGSGLSAQQINDYASTASTGALNGYQNGAGDDDRVNGNYS